VNRARVVVGVVTASNPISSAMSRMRNEWKRSETSTTRTPQAFRNRADARNDSHELGTVSAQDRAVGDPEEVAGARRLSVNSSPAIFRR
jgi:hypothetical protein